MTLLTRQLLEEMEKDQVLKAHYAGRGAFLKNKLIAIPVLILFSCVLVLWGLYELKMLPTIYTAIALVVAILAAIAINRIFVRSKAAVIQGIDQIPVVLARKIYGNDRDGNYYAIYSKGQHRHSHEFIDRVAQKILSIDDEPDPKIRQRINQLFAERLAGVGPRGAQLPIEFTFGEPVYHAEVNLARLRDVVAQNDDRFAMIVFDPIQVAVIEAAHIARS